MVIEVRPAAATELGREGRGGGPRTSRFALLRGGKHVGSSSRPPTLCGGVPPGPPALLCKGWLAIIPPSLPFAEAVAWAREGGRDPPTSCIPSLSQGFRYQRRSPCGLIFRIIVVFFWVFRVLERGMTQYPPSQCLSLAHNPTRSLCRCLPPIHRPFHPPLACGVPAILRAHGRSPLTPPGGFAPLITRVVSVSRCLSMVGCTDWRRELYCFTTSTTRLVDSLGRRTTHNVRFRRTVATARLCLDTFLFITATNTRSWVF